MSNLSTMKACPSPTVRSLFGAPYVLALLLLSMSTAGADPKSLIGQAAPDFALPSYGGDNVRLSEYVGQPVIVSFWSSNCAECASQLARLERYYDIYQSSGLVVLGVSVDDDLQRAQRYAHAHHTDFPLLLDAAKAVARAFQIDRLPTTVLIDRSGVVHYLHDGYRADDVSYVKQIRALLDDDAPDSVGLAP